MKVAVIGTGVAGLGAAWLLHRHCDLHVYEQEGRVGGHSNTVEVPGHRPGETVAVDTGFIVYNELTYPNLIRLFAALDVPTEASTMSFAVSADGGRLEYAGGGLRALFGQRRNLLRPSHYRMIRDILRFYREAPALLERSEEREVTLGDYLLGQGFGDGFVYNHLLPMGAAIWSTTSAEMMRFPARSFVRFFHNHGLLKVRDRPQWRTVTGGSREYVRRLTAPFADRIRRDCAAVRVDRRPHSVMVRDAAGHEDRFDEVVIATHGDQALRLLGDADAGERAVLGAFRYTPNRTILHSDPALMPRRRAVWSSWNYLREGRDRDTRVSVTYWMNRLQNLDERVPLFVSLNPLRQPDPDRVHAELSYDHPQFDASALNAQHDIPFIQGRRSTWFCGSYCGYGFHEDALAAGLAVAEALGARRPWTLEREASPAAANATPVQPGQLAAE